MIIRTIAAFMLLASSAWAQSAETPAPSETSAAAPAVIEAPAVAVIPTDPAELATYAIAQGRAQQCRFAYTRLQTTAAQSGWADADAEGVIRFDPRLPIGERFTVVRASRQQRALQRVLARQDRLGLPFDLMALSVEGEWGFENVQFKSETPESYVYSYTPHVPPERAADATGVGILEQLIGELEVSRTTGRVLHSTLREPQDTAVRALGIVRVQRALLHNAYAPGAGDINMVESGSQMFQMSAMLSQTAVTTSFRVADVEPICDPAAVAQIEQAETAARAERRH